MSEIGTGLQSQLGLSIVPSQARAPRVVRPANRSELSIEPPRSVTEDDVQAIVAFLHALSVDKVQRSATATEP